MPTGYTSIIEDKADVTFREYATRCARAFGACIMQREEGLGTAMRPREPQSHYAEQLATEQARLVELDGMSEAQAEVILTADFAADSKRHEEWNRDAKEKAERYDRIRADVEAWSPPTPEHVELKKFMLQQITVSYTDSVDVERWAPKRIEARAWLDDRITKARDTIAYYEQKIREDAERCAESKAWIEALEASL